MGILDHLICLLRNLYAGQEATVQIRHGTMDWIQIEKGVHQGRILPSCLYNFCALFIMPFAWLNDAQANQDCREKYQYPQICRWHHSYGRKWRGTKELLEESEKAVLKLNIQKTKIMASGLITSWQIDGETMETMTEFISLGSKITADGEWLQPKKGHFLFGRKAMTNLDSILESRDIILPTKACLAKLWFFQ